MATPEKKKTCFVIMPITTPEELVASYSNDHKHFIHVLEHLFKPAVESVGYKLISPLTKGADLIHAEIIKNIERSDLVLCDMSSLNPNVFFELGIRTALNRPVCMVKDDVTQTVPFDTGVVNYHSYLSSLAPWTLDEEIQKLRDHITESISRSESINKLWKHFGITNVAKEYKQEPGANPELEYIIGQLEIIKQRIESRREKKEVLSNQSTTNRTKNNYSDLITQLLRNKGFVVGSMTFFDPDMYVITDYDKEAANELRHYIDDLEKLLEVAIELV